MVEWFKRLADVPGVTFAGSPGVDRSQLPWADLEPQLNVWEFDGERHESLDWATPDGATSASPAELYAVRDARGVGTDDLIRALFETLELPGKASDYHFAIQGTAEVLWTRRREEPTLSSTIEELFWLDIKLIRAKPDTVTNHDAAGVSRQKPTDDRRGVLVDLCGELVGERPRLALPPARLPGPAAQLGHPFARRPVGVPGVARLLVRRRSLHRLRLPALDDGRLGASLAQPFANAEAMR